MEEERWEEGCLVKFSQFMGLLIEGYKYEILDLMKRVDTRRRKKKKKGGQSSTKYDREMKILNGQL